MNINFLIKRLRKLLCISLLLVGIFDAIATDQGDYSAQMTKRAIVVIRAKIMEPGEGSKYRWAKLKVLQIIKNESGLPIGESLDVAYLSSEDTTLPSGEFFAYLELYNERQF